MSSCYCKLISKFIFLTQITPAAYYSLLFYNAMIGCRKPLHSNKNSSKIAQLQKLTLNKRIQEGRLQIIKVIIFVFYYDIMLHGSVIGLRGHIRYK